MIKKLLSFGSKSNDFFLELDENKEEQASNGNQASAVNSAVAQETKAVDSAAAVQTESASTNGKVEVSKTTAAAKPISSKTNIKKVKSQAKVSSKKSQPASQATATVAKNNGASSWEQPFWVKAMYNNSSNGSNGNNSEATFATDYLVETSPRPNRRPGPSLNKFKDMAKKVGRRGF